MSYGLQISASGAMTALYRQDVFANDLANMDTVGYKPDIPSAAPRLAMREEDGAGWIPSNSLLERLGGGTLLNPNRVNFSQGALLTTGNPLDLAMRGKGFFAVRDSNAEGGETVRLTRDGRFTRNAQGTLVMATSGLPVLDQNGAPITLPAGGRLLVGGDGVVSVDGQRIAQLRVIEPPDPARLRKVGHSLFDAGRDVLERGTPATGDVVQGALEDSGVDEVRALLQMTSAAREVDANIDMMRTHDRLMERAMQAFSRS